MGLRLAKSRRSSSGLCLRLTAVCTAVLLNGASAGVTTPPDQRAKTGGRHYCPREAQPPLEIQLERPTGPIALGQSYRLAGSVRSSVDVPQLRLRFESTGPVSLGGLEEVPLGFVAAGSFQPLDLSLRYEAPGESEVHVWAEALSETGEPLFSVRETLYGLARSDKVFAGLGDMQECRRAAIDDDLAAGRLSADHGAKLREALAAVPNAVADPLGASALGPSQPLSPGGSITVQGNVQWTDENGTTHPVYRATVRIMDQDLLVDELVATVETDTNGNYGAIVNNDDGVLQGDRDIFVRVLSENAWVDTQTTGGTTYSMQSGVQNEVPDGSVLVRNFTAGNTGIGPAFSVFQAGTWIGKYAEQVHGAPLPQVDVVWPNGSTGSFYDGQVQIEQPDRWDWDTIHHEYGHYAADQINIENNPGGPHNIGDCIVDVRPTKSEALRLAWGEGWPTYFGTSGQQVLNLASLNVPRVGDVSYQDLEDGSLTYSLESQSGIGVGEDNEVAVQRLLWDLFDTASDGRDGISRSDASVWSALNAADPTTLSGAWGALRAGQSDLLNLLMGEIATDHAIGPSLVAPAQGTIVNPAAANFSWNAAVGCSATNAGDSFDLVFFDPASFAPLLTIPGLVATSHALSAADFGMLIASGHEVLWAVEGRNTAGPASGPYLGESFEIVLNRRPEANAGPDQPAVECASHTTTPVALSGLASSDPDLDPLSYSWTAPGVVFDNPNSATPTGQFPEGTTVVTLTVSDGYQQDTDQVSITVVDTTPPALVCPASVAVECTEHGGTPASHPPIAAFLGAASATDICDPSPSLANDAPPFFPLGATQVTFTATDDATNQSTCQRSVTVADTTPPVINVTLNRYVLWPPNHKLVDIQANVTVTDVCDPDPSFVLTSITSNQPQNGTGDGDTAPDIAGAALGTPDTLFQLRSERQGGDPAGRLYAITYTAMDSSGNTAQALVHVLVPHHQ